MDEAGNPGRHEAVEAAIFFLAKLGVSRFPLEPEKIIPRMGWGLKTYAWLAGVEGVTDWGDLSDMGHSVFSSTDAMICRKGGKYLIAYNHKVRPYGRMNFSLMHEVGHIVLGHLDSLRPGSFPPPRFSGELLRRWDREADCFASNTLAPAILAKQFQATLTPGECRWIFRMSQAAWSTRLSLLRQDYALVTAERREAQRRQYGEFVKLVESRKGSIVGRVIKV